MSLLKNKTFNPVPVVDPEFDGERSNNTFKLSGISADPDGLIDDGCDDSSCRCSGSDFGDSSFSLLLLSASAAVDDDGGDGGGDAERDASATAAAVAVVVVWGSLLFASMMMNVCWYLWIEQAVEIEIRFVCVRVLQTDRERRAGSFDLLLVLCYQSFIPST